MTDEESSGFTVVDKRRVNEGASEVPSEVQATSPPAGPDAEVSAHDEDAQPELPHLPIPVRLLMCIDILQQGAWIAMGLVSDPATGAIERDLKMAKIAIDSVAYLSEQIQGELDEQTRREVKSRVSDLQMNYVHQMSRKV